LIKKNLSEKGTYNEDEELIFLIVEGSEESHTKDDTNDPQKEANHEGMG